MGGGGDADNCLSSEYSELEDCGDDGRVEVSVHEDIMEETELWRARCQVVCSGLRIDV